MPSELPSSVRLFARVAASESDAQTQLFHRYLKRLCRLAQLRLSRKLNTRLDAEDVVMSAYRSFFVGAREGRFLIQESSELWALLAKITLRKVYRSAAHHTASKRSIQKEAASGEREGSAGTWLVSEQPSADEAIVLADEVEHLLRRLDPSSRRIVELRLQGESSESIAILVNVTDRTVRRVLADVLAQLKDHHNPSDFERIQVQTATADDADKQAASESKTAAGLVNSQDASVASVAFQDLLIHRLIGRGGMGKVYDATIRSSSRSCAVKFLHKRLEQDPEIVRRFLEEARLVNQLQHPAIVPVLGLGVTKSGSHFIVMERINGTTLADQLAEGPLQIQAALDIIRSVAEAVQHAHLAGIIHCDLKPANILRSHEGLIFVADFGLAELSNLQRSNPEEGCIAGTIPWMAPEQIDPVFGRISERTDVYGMGALLFALLTGRAPFAAPRMPDLLSLILTTPVAPPSSLRSGLSSDLDRLTMKCLSKQPSDRFSSAADLLASLISARPSDP